MATGHWENRIVQKINEDTGKRYNVTVRVWVVDKAPVSNAASSRNASALAQRRRAAQRQAAARRARIVAQKAAAQAKLATERRRRQLEASGELASKQRVAAQAVAAQKALVAARQAAFTALQQRQVALVRRAGLIKAEGPVRAPLARKPTINVDAGNLASTKASERREQFALKASYNANLKTNTAAYEAQRQQNAQKELYAARGEYYRRQMAMTQAKAGDANSAKNIEAVLATEAAKMKNGTASSAVIGKLQEQYEAHAAAVADKWQALVAKFNAAADKGDRAAAERIYYSKDFQSMGAEFKRLFGSGDNPLKDGSYGAFQNQLSQIALQQREWWKRQTQASLQTQLQTLRRNGEAEEAARVQKQLDAFKGRGTGNVQVGVDSQGRAVYRQRTIEEELQSQQAVIEMQRQKLAMERGISEQRRKAIMMREGLVDVDGQAVNREDVPLIKRAKELVERSYGGQAPTFKRQEDLQTFADQLVADWQKKNPPPPTGNLRDQRYVNALNAYNQKVEDYQRQVYRFFGSKPPEWYERVMQAPVISHGLSILQAPSSAIGAAWRVFGAEARGGTTTIGEGLNWDKAPASWQSILAAHRASPDYGTFNARSIQSLKDEWLATPEGKKWAEAEYLANRTASHEEDKTFAEGFYGNGDIGSKFRALNEYGSQPFQNEGANLLFSLIADPFNGIPLKFTTYAARGAYAQDILKGSSALKKFTLGPKAFLTVDEGTLRMRKQFAEILKQLQKDGIPIDKLVEQARETITGSGEAAVKKTKVDALLRASGVNAPLVESGQLFNMIEYLATQKVKEGGGKLLTQADQVTAGRLADLKKADDAAKKMQAKQASEAEKAAKTQQKEVERAEASRAQLAQDRAALEEALRNRAEKVEAAVPAPKPAATAVPESVVAAAPVKKAAAPKKNVASGKGMAAQRRSKQPAVKRAKYVAETGTHANQKPPKTIKNDPLADGPTDNPVSAAQSASITAAVKKKVNRGTKTYTSADEFFEPDRVGNLLPRNFQKSAEYRTLEASTLKGDVVARGQLETMARRARNDLALRAEDAAFAGGRSSDDPARRVFGSGAARSSDIKYKPNSATLVDRAGLVNSRTATARLLRDRKTIRTLKARTVTSMKERSQSGLEWVRGHRRGYIEPNKPRPFVDYLDRAPELNDYGDLVPQAWSATVTVGEDIILSSLTHRGVRDLYETFSHDALKFYQKSPFAQMRKLLNPDYVRNMTDDFFEDMVARISEPEAFMGNRAVDAKFQYEFQSQGAASYRDGGMYLFEVFHQLRLSGDLDKLRRFSDYMDQVLVDSEDNLFAWMWKTMEERANLPWAKDYRTIRDGFYEAAQTYNLHPELAWSAIPNGYSPKRMPMSFGLSARLEGMAESASDLFYYATSGYTPVKARNEITRIMMLGQGEATRVVHYVAERFGDFYKGGEVNVRLKDELVHAAGLALGPVELTKVILRRVNMFPPAAMEKMQANALATGRSFGDIVFDNVSNILKSNGRTVGVGKLRPQYDDFRDSIQAAYHAGELPAMNRQAHTLMFLAHIQTKPTAYVQAVRTYMGYMIKLGGEDLAYGKKLVGTLYENEIMTDSLRWVNESNGRPPIRDAISGEVMPVVDRSRIKMWRDMGLLPDEGRLRAYAAKQRANADELNLEFEKELERSKFIGDDSELARQLNPFSARAEYVGGGSSMGTGTGAPGGGRIFEVVDTSNFESNVASLVADIRRTDDVKVIGRLTASLEGTLTAFMRRLVAVKGGEVDEMMLDQLRDAIIDVSRFPEARRLIVRIQNDLGDLRLKQKFADGEADVASEWARLNRELSVAEQKANIAAREAKAKLIPEDVSPTLDAVEEAQMRLDEVEAVVREMEPDVRARTKALFEERTAEIADDSALRTATSDGVPAAKMVPRTKTMDDYGLFDIPATGKKHEGASAFTQVDYGTKHADKGVKVHISIDFRDMNKAISEIDRVARAFGLSYKYVKALKFLTDPTMFGKGAAQQGKAFTIYLGAEEAVYVVRDIAERLKNAGVRYSDPVPTERQVSGTGIYYRKSSDFYGRDAAVDAAERRAPDGGYAAGEVDPLADLFKAAEPLPPPVRAPEDGAAYAHTAHMYDYIFKMNEQEWFNFEKGRAKRVLDNPKASPAAKTGARKRLREIKSAEFVVQVQKKNGNYIPWQRRASFQSVVLAKHGAEIESRVAPKMISPYGLTAASAAVEQGRTYWRLLKSASTKKVHSKVKGITINGKIVDHIPKKVWDDIEQRVADAISASRDGRRADIRTQARYKPLKTESQRPIGKMKDQHEGVLKAKKAALEAYAKETGIVISMDAYDEVRKVLWRGYVGNKTHLWLLARTSAIVKRTGADFEDVFLELRAKEAKLEARRQFGSMAYGELFGQSPEYIKAEFIRRYSDDTVLKTFTPELTSIQRATLEAHVKHLAGADKLDERIGVFLQSANRPPFESRELTRKFLQQIGAWSPRTTEDFATGAKTWSVEQEAKYWRDSYGEVPEWADKATLKGEMNAIFHDPELYYKQMKAWGIFSRANELKLRTSGLTSREIEELQLKGDVALAIPARREFDLQRKFAMERYGDLVHDNGFMTAMPWLMTPEEYGRYMAKRGADAMPEGFINSPQKLAQVTDIIQKQMERVWGEVVEAKIKRGELPDFHDMHRVASLVQAEMLNNPVWARTFKNYFGDTLDGWAKFNRWLVFSNPSFLVTNTVDSYFKAGWHRIFQPGLYRMKGWHVSREIADAADALSPEMLGENATSSMYRLKEAKSWERLKKPRGYTRMNRAVDRALAVADFTGEWAPHLAGQQELARKMAMARSMYPTVYTQAMKTFKNADLAQAETLRFIKAEIARMWPTAGDGPIERLWNRIVPFSSYNIRNKVMFMGEAASHPQILNYIDRIGSFIEQENLKQWEEDHPGTEMPNHLRRMIQLPWAPDYFLDLSTFFDATRGLQPLYAFEKDKSTLDRIASWVRLVNPGTQALAYAFLNAFGVGQKMMWVPILDGEGFPTGRYEQKMVGWNEPWSDKLAHFGSAFWFNETLTMGAQFLKDGEFSTGEMSQLFGQIMFFNGVQTFDRGSVLNSFYMQLRQNNPDGAKEWLKTPDGYLLQDWWAAKALKPRDVMDRLNDMERAAADPTPWFHDQSPAFQARVKTARQEISDIYDTFKAELATLMPGTAEYKRMKAQMYMAINDVYLNNPELMAADVYSKTPAEWSKQLADWASDKLMDTFMQMNAQRPQRADFKTRALYDKAVADWETAKKLFLHTYPEVALKLDQGRTEVDRVRDQMHADWDRVFDRLAARKDKIAAAEKIIADAGRDSAAGKAAQDRLDLLYLSNTLDYGLLERDYAASFFDETDLKKMPKGMFGPPTLRDGITKRVTLLMDFDRTRYEKALREGTLEKFIADQEYGRTMAAAISYAKGGDPFGEFDGKRWGEFMAKHPEFQKDYFGQNPEKRIAFEKTATYVAGMQRLWKLAGNDPAKWVRLLKQNPKLMAEYFRRNPGKREKWAATDRYIRHISVWGKLIGAGKFEAAAKAWENLPADVRKRYLDTHPESKMGQKGRSVQTATYMGYMEKWVNLFKGGDSKKAMEFFNSLPQWAKDRYYDKHPEKRAEFELQDKMAGKLANYFASADEDRAAYLKANPDLAKWLAKNGGDKNRERFAILAAYKKIPKEEAWLRRVFREKYPEIFSQKAAGERRLKSVYDTLAKAPSLLPGFEKWVNAIWESYDEMLKTAPRPKNSFFEPVREVPRRAYKRSLSAEEANKFSHRKAYKRQNTK